MTIVISCITYFSVVIGELVTKTFAMNNLIRKLKERSDFYSIIAGYILEKTGHIAHARDYFKTDGYKDEVVDINVLKIDKVLITKIKEKKEIIIL